MRTIWKYPLEIDDVNLIHIPADAELLTVQMQDDRPCLWVAVEDTNPLEQRKLRIAGTGHNISNPVGRHYDYIATFQLMGGNLVFHVFEEVENNAKS